MAIVTPLLTSDTFRTWLTRTNTAIDLLNSNTVIAGVNATGTFAIANGTSDTTSSLTVYHATGGQTLANSTGLFISGNMSVGGTNFAVEEACNVFTVTSNTSILQSPGGTTINSAVVASKTLLVTGALTGSNTFALTGAATFSANVTVANNLTASNTVYARAMLHSETGAVVSEVLSTSNHQNYTVTGLDDAQVLRINPNVYNIVIGGILAPTNLTTLASGGNGAKLLYLQNAGGTYKITLQHADTSSTDVNRFVGVTSADVVIPPGGAVTLLYTVAESRWRVLAQVEPHVNRTESISTVATLTPDPDEKDLVSVYAQAEALVISNPSPQYTVVNGQKFILRIKDDGTNRAITWGDEYRAIQSSLPSTTTASKTLYLGFIYNSTDTKWDLVANAQEA